MAYVTGDKELDRTLNALETKIAQKAIKAGVTSGLTEITKAIRAGVNTSGAPAGVKHAARTLISKRFKKSTKTGYVSAKAGFAVGKQSKRRRAQAAERAAGGQGGTREKKGVGIGARNIHWFVLGTTERRTKNTKRSLGRIEPFLDGVVQAAMGDAMDHVMAKARSAIEATVKKSLKVKG